MLKRYFGKTDQGPLLKINEDGMLIEPFLSLYGVIDAFGGVAIGDEFVKFLKDEIIKGFSSHLSDPDKTLSYFFDPLRPVEVNGLFNLILELNKKSLELNSKKNFFQRAGASLLIALQVEETLHVFSVGVSQMWLLRKKQVIPICKSNAIQKYEPKAPERFKIDTSSQHIIPKTALGLNLNLEISWNPCRILEGDLFFLASTGVLLDGDLISLLTSIPERTSQTPPLQIMVDRALEYSNSKGNIDNQTLLLLEY